MNYFYEIRDWVLISSVFCKTHLGAISKKKHKLQLLML